MMFDSICVDKARGKKQSSKERDKNTVEMIRIKKFWRFTLNKSRVGHASLVLLNFFLFKSYFIDIIEQLPKIH